jgi:hypothetical protein
MLYRDSILDSKNVRCNPVHWLSESRKSPVHHHEIFLSQDRSRLVLQRWREALDKIEETVAARCDMGAMLNVIRRPEPFRCRVVALIEQGFERFNNDGLILCCRWFTDFASLHCSGLLQHRIVELGYKRPFVWTWVVAERLRPLHQDFLCIRPKNADGFLDEFGKGHRPRFIVAAHQVGLHPGGSDLGLGYLVAHRVFAKEESLFAIQKELEIAE